MTVNYKVLCQHIYTHKGTSVSATTVMGVNLKNAIKVDQTRQLSVTTDACVTEEDMCPWPQ